MFGRSPRGKLWCGGTDGRRSQRRRAQPAACIETVEPRLLLTAQIDLVGDGANVLKLSPDDAAAQVDETNRVDVLGDAEDMVRLLPGWEAVSLDETFIVFQSGSTTLGIERDVTFEMALDTDFQTGGRVNVRDDAGTLSVRQGGDTLFQATTQLLTDAIDPNIGLALLIAGTNAADRIDASRTSLPLGLRMLGGNDTVHGSAGTSFVSGGDRDDEIHGGMSPDNLQGDSGNDTLMGFGGWHGD